MGYDNYLGLKLFGKSDIDKIVVFMQTKLHKLLKTKFKSSEEDYEAEMTKLYGMFASMPEGYEILGGCKYIILACAEAVRSSEFSRQEPQSSKRHALSWSTKDTSTQKKRKEDTEEHMKTDLVAKFTAWVNKHVPNHMLDLQKMDCDDENYFVEVQVSKLGNKWSAVVTCPVQGCSKPDVKVNKNASWNTNNFHRHIELWHLLQKGRDKNEDRAKGVTITSMLQRKKKSSSDTQKKDGNNEETPVVHIESEDGKISGNDSDQSSSVF